MEFTRNLRIFCEVGSGHNFALFHNEMSRHLLSRNSVLTFLVFFQNEEIFVQLDELDKLDKITHA